MNVTPYVTRTGTWQDPYEAFFNDPVYNMADNNDDNIPDNPGEILYYVPTRTGQKSTQNINIGLSATISIPLDKKAMEQCKESVELHNEYRTQAIADDIGYGQQLRSYIYLLLLYLMVLILLH